MQILLVTVGSHGDIHPFIALGRALESQGHRAPILTNPHFAPVIEHAGLECLAIGDDLDIKDVIATQPVMDPHKGPMTVMRELMLPVVGQVYERTREALREIRADVCVTHPICMGATWACEQAGVPCDTAALAPSIWFNPRDRLVMTPWGSDNPSDWFVRLQLCIGRFMMRRALDPGLNRVRRELGLPRLRDGFFTDALGGRHNLGMWSAHFRPALPGDPPTARICGFPWHDTVRDPDPEWARIEKFLGEGEPPIVFTLGTAAVHSAGRFYEHAAGACTLLNRRGLLLMGRPEYLPQSPRPNVGAFCYAPYSKLLPRAAATVHHCGIGTTAQVLRSGRPGIGVPHAHDQFDNAARLKRLGVSQTVNSTRVSAQRLAAALRVVLDDPLYAARAAELGPAIGSGDGALAAADIITRG